MSKSSTEIVAEKRPIAARNINCHNKNGLGRHSRCQRSNVVGVMMNERQRERGRRRLAAAKNSRSTVLIAGRVV
jgi:hypothetical protein